MIYQLSNHHSQQYINYCCKNNLLYCCSLCLCNSTSYIFSTWRDCSQTCFHSTFKQRIVILMCMCTCDCQTIKTETSKTPTFWVRFFYNMILFQYWLAIPFISVMFFYWQVYFRQVKATNKTAFLLACFFYNTILYWLSNLAIGITFSSSK